MAPPDRSPAIRSTESDEHKGGCSCLIRDEITTHTPSAAKLDGILENARAKTGVPGVAAAVVYRGRLVYAKGFGVRDVNVGGRVSPQTVFRLASVSKALSGTVVAGIVGRTKLEWSDPVASRLPGFRLSDPYVSRNVTVADLFSHRSGLPDHAGDLLEDLGYDRAYLVGKLALEPLKPFRAQWLYTNFGLTAAAVAAARVTGRRGPRDRRADEPNTFYAGTYNNDFYGPIKIVAESSGLHLLIGPNPNDYPLGHWDGNRFSFFPTGENAVGITQATFTPNAAGTQATSVTLEYYDADRLGTFTRA
jgi:hypothetical protein